MLEDFLRVIQQALADSNLSGALNAVSPAPVTNADFTRALARALRRPALLPMPTMAVKLLFGEMGYVGRKPVPGSVDWLWIVEHTSSK